MCDQISDAVLDAHLKQDPDAKVACGKNILCDFFYELNSKLSSRRLDIAAIDVNFFGYELNCITCVRMYARNTLSLLFSESSSPHSIIFNQRQTRVSTRGANTTFYSSST